MKPTAGSNYYQIQSSARGIHDLNDVQRLAEESAPIYKRTIKPWLSSNLQSAIYEVACGPGILQSWLNSQGYQNIWGSDLSSNEARLAIDINPRIVNGDSVADVIVRGEEQYDTIIALDFIEHIPKDMVIPFLENAYRALKPGGCLIMRAPNADSPIVGLNLFNDMTHVWAYTTVSMRAMTRSVGYTSVHFMDDTLSCIHKHRWIKYPIILCAQFIVKKILSCACRAKLYYLGSTIYIYAKK